MEHHEARPRRRPRHPGLFSLYGGKARLAPWIIEQLPAHEGYCEPFCGGARVLFAKPRAKTEIINDLDRGVYSAFKAARDCPEALADALRLTPYSRAEHAQACLVASGGYDVGLVEAARAFLTMVQQQMFAMSTPRNWRQPHSHAILSGPQGHWAQLPDVVEWVAERLRGVAIECRPALDVIEYLDHPRMLMYLDPPYHPSSCDCKGYRCTLTRDDHRALTDALRGLRSMVVLSGYAHPDYDEWLPGWQSLRCQTIASTSAAAGKGKAAFERTEVLWFNEAAWSARESRLAANA